MKTLEDATRFHGHFCPGLLIGFRAAQIALRELGVERAEHAELIAICENDACGVDAVQTLTGCTVGKGNLVLRDWGKQVFTFGRRSDGRMLRVALRYEATAYDPAMSPEAHRQTMLERLQTASDEALYDIRWVEIPWPDRMRNFHSVPCSQCGEGVTEARAHLRGGQPVCLECQGAPSRGGW